jgi:hypothetical protein
MTEDSVIVDFSARKYSARRYSIQHSEMSVC